MKHKSTTHIITIVLNGCLGALVFGYSLSYLSVSMKTIYIVFNIEQSEQSFFKGFSTCLVPFGAAFGSLLTGHLLQVYSRRKCMIIADLIAIAGCGLQLYPNTYLFWFGRFFLGISVGISSGTVPIYIKEFSPIQISGLCGSLFYILICVGLTMGYIVGLGYTQNSLNYWRFVFCLPIIMSTIRSFLLILIFKRETPIWYHNQNMKDQCEQTIKELYHSEYVNEIVDSMYSESGKQSTFGELFSRKWLRQTTVGTVVLMMQQLNGISGINFYSNDLFEATTSEQDAKYLTIFVGFFQVIAGLLCGYSTKFLGRKPILLFGLPILGLLQVFISILYLLDQHFKESVYSVILVILIYLFVFIFGISIGPISWVFCAEVLNEKGLAFAVLMKWLVVALIGFIIPLENEWIGVQGVCYQFAIICFLGTIFVFYFVKETKNRSVYEITQMYGMEEEDLRLNQDIQKRTYSLDQSVQ